MTLEDRILFIDGEALVLDKPHGLPVDPPRAGGPNIVDRAHELTCGFQRPPVAMHRLDRDTSGCLLFARNPKAVKRFQQVFEAGEVGKTYLAVIDGTLAEEEGTISLPLGKISTREAGWRMVPDETGKPAITDWRRLGERDGRTLVAFTPRTGRTHQLRVHAARALGAAIVGDPVYAEAGADPAQPMLLHAWKLHVPRGAKPPIDVTAPPPDHFGTWLDFVP